MISIIVVVVITVMLLMQAMTLSPSFDNLDFIPYGSESRKIIESHNRNFPATSVNVIISAPDVTEPEFFEMMNELAKEFKKFDQVKEVDSPSQLLMDRYQGIPDREIIEDTLLGTSAMPDRSSVLMKIILHEYDSAQGDSIAVELQRIGDFVQKPEGTELKFLNDPVLNYELNQSANESIGIMFVSAVVLMILVLYLISGFNVRGKLMPFAPLSVAVISVIWVMGSLSVFGFRLTPITTAFLPILIGMSIDYGVVIQNRYEEEIRGGQSVSESLKWTIYNSGKGVSFALVTTLLGFSSLFVTGVPSLQSFGFALSVGLITSFIISLIFMTAMISIKDRCPYCMGRADVANNRDPIIVSNTKTNSLDKYFGRLMEWIVHNSIRYSAIILVAVLVVFSYGASNFGNLPFISDPLDYFPKELKTNRNLAYFDTHFGRGEDIVVVITDMDVREPKNLEHILDIQRYVASREDEITSSKSIASIAEAHFSGIPSSRAQVDTLIENLPDHGDYILDNSKIIITFYTNRLEDEEMDPTVERIRRDVVFFDPFMDFYIVGGPVIKESITKGMISGQNIMTLISFILVFSVLLLIFRSLSGAVSTIIPVMVVLAATIAGMQILKIPHTMLSVSINTVIIGTGIDYAIHLTERYEEERQNGLLPVEAIKRSWKHTGLSVFTASASTAGGFLAMKASPYPIFQYFGTIAFISISFALSLTVVVLPPLLLMRDDPEKLGWFKRISPCLSRLFISRSKRLTV